MQGHVVLRIRIQPRRAARPLPSWVRHDVVVFLLLAHISSSILHSRKFFETVKPVNFTTFASPHIGLPRYRSLISAFTAMVCRKLLSRTGEQFYGLDKWGKGGIPLLEVMANKGVPDFCFRMGMRNLRASV